MAADLTFWQWTFDVPLAFGLPLLAWGLLATPDLFKAVVLFIVFGFLLSLGWARLGAPDVALAEAAIGAGLTGALLLSALGRMGVWRDGRRGAPGRFPLAVLSLGVGLALGSALWSLPGRSPGLQERVAAELSRSGASNPVTAVLLNFRGYDTLLEVGVLLLAVLGVRSLGSATVPREILPAGPVLSALLRFLSPPLVIVGGYLLWAGADGAGGAFQAGAVLGAGGVLWLLAGERPPVSPPGWSVRPGLAAGFGVFLAVAIGTLARGRALLEYPPEWAGVLMLLIETAVTLSVAATMIALFAGVRSTRAEGSLKGGEP